MLDLAVAVAVALGGDAACDIAVVRTQPGVFGLVASDPTVSRLVARLAVGADAALEAITAARAAARERVSDVAGAPVQDGKVVIDLDATLLDAHSEKEDATRTWKNSLNFVDVQECGGVGIPRSTGFVGLGMGHLVELGELGAGSRDAGLQAFQLSEPSFAAGFVDPGDQVVADVDEPVALGGVGS